MTHIIEHSVVLDEKQVEMERELAELQVNSDARDQKLAENSQIGKEATEQIKTLFAEYDKPRQVSTAEKIQPLIMVAAYFIDSKSKNKSVRDSVGGKLRLYHKSIIDRQERETETRRQKLLDRVAQVNLQTQSALAENRIEFERLALESRTSLEKLTITQRGQLSAKEKSDENEG